LACLPAGVELGWLGKPHPFGLMLPTQLVRQPQGMQLAKALGAVYYRPSSALFVDEWNGSCPECDKARDAGLQLVLTVRANGRGQATSPPSDLAAYQRTLSQVLDTYPPSLLVVENEENSALFYTGTPEEYAAQLQAACQVAHARGIPCTNGGLVSTLVALLVYHHYLESGQRQAAQDFAQRVFTPQEQALLDSPQAQEQVRKGKALLASYRAAGADYVNFHWYIADTQALGEAVAFLTSQTGLPALTNEIGQHNDDPNQTTAVMGKVVELGLPIAVWFSVDAAKARALVNPAGSLRPTGEAFQRFIAEHFGVGDSWRSPRRHLSREPKRAESPWWIVAEALTETNAPVVERAIQQWQEMGTFDAFVVGILPPTFYDWGNWEKRIGRSQSLANVPAACRFPRLRHHARACSTSAPLACRWGRKPASGSRARQLDAPPWEGAPRRGASSGSRDAGGLRADAPHRPQDPRVVVHQPLLPCPHYSESQPPHRMPGFFLTDPC
jgi:hypothetical protein